MRGKQNTNQSFTQDTGFSLSALFFLLVAVFLALGVDVKENDPISLRISP
jgi:hypothetical protein